MCHKKLSLGLLLLCCSLALSSAQDMEYQNIDIELFLEQPQSSQKTSSKSLPSFSQSMKMNLTEQTESESSSMKSTPLPMQPTQEQSGLLQTAVSLRTSLVLAYDKAKSLSADSKKSKEEQQQLLLIISQLQNENEGLIAALTSNKDTTGEIALEIGRLSDEVYKVEKRCAALEKSVKAWRKIAIGGTAGAIVIGFVSGFLMGRTR